MNKKSIILTGVLLVALIVSVLVNLQQHNEIDALEKKIHTFIPAAQNLEAENIRLQEKSTSQQERIFELEHEKTVRNNMPPEPPLPVLPEIPQPSMQLPQNNTFKDLNKKEGL